MLRRLPFLLLGAALASLAVPGRAEETRPGMVRIPSGEFSMGMADPRGRDHGGMEAMADILADVCPAWATPSIQTAPLAFKPRVTGQDVIDTFTDHVFQLVAHLVKLEQETGKLLTLGIEPEPRCYLETTDETVGRTLALAQALGKTPITVKNAPGFVVNRVLIPMINEAFFVLSEGLASPDDIDAGMRLGCNQPIGPLALADMIGLDVCLAVMEVYLAEFGDSKYRPCPLLKEMVAAGRLGRKTKQGVYSYA